MSLLTTPVMQFVDGAGVPMAFGKAYFYLTGTTDPAAVYQDAALTLEHTWPVVADDQGMFPAIYFSQDTVLRLKVIEALGDLINPDIDVDPVNELFTVGANNIADGAIEEKLGYTPVDPANAVFTNNVRQDFVPGELNEDDMGFRGERRNIKNANYTLELNDSQSLLIKDDTSTPTWTLPLNATVGWAIGHYFWAFNQNTGNVTLAGAIGVTLIEAGDITFTAGNKTLGPGAYVKVQKIGEDEWVVTQLSHSSLGVNGYIRHPSGLIEQWGKYDTDIAPDDNATVAYPIPFPTACYGVYTQPFIDADAQCDVTLHVVGTPDLDDFTVTSQSDGSFTINGFFWHAKGK